MIEIEQQFPFTPSLLSSIKQKLNQTGTKELIETYFDTKDFQLLNNDTWLRNRNGKYELKYRKPEDRGKQLEVYLELSAEDEIKYFLHVETKISLDDWIRQNLSPSIQIKTIRHTFKKDNFTVDIDITDFGYSVCEIEYETSGDLEQAKKEIIIFANELKLEQKPAKNKAKAYVEQKHPELVRELKANGIL